MAAPRLVLRGLSLRLLKTYLVKLGASETAPDRFEGAGWAVELCVRQVPVLRSQMDEITAAFSGEPAAVDDAVARLRKMTLRGGG
mgnify:CR=1 FL=1